MKTKQRTAAKAGKPKQPKNRENPFHAKLGTTTYSQACKLLGDEGPKLIREGASLFSIEFDRDVYLGGDLLRIRVQDHQVADGVAIVTMTLMSGRNRQIHIQCDRCEIACKHGGAAVDYLMDSKELLGLAAPPDEDVPLEHLTRKELMLRVIADRRKRAREEKMQVRSNSLDEPWSDYVVTSEQSGRSYRVAIRSLESTGNYCTCPDYRTNQVEVCKHIFHVQYKLKRKFSAQKLNQPYGRKRLSLRVSYGPQIGLLFSLPTRCDAKVKEIVGTAAKTPITSAQEALHRINALTLAGCELVVFPDAEKMIQRELDQSRIRTECEAIRKNPASHPFLKELLNATLMPYQLDGIAFCAGAGRAILADDMGLGKTIQAIGVAELLARVADVQRVLIICPASLKSQWRSEIVRFSGRSTQIVIGTGAERVGQYASNAFFTICNYEQVMRDLTSIEQVPWDLIVLDEGQRIKNWESKTSNIIRQLDSPFRLILSGTPLENRLGELFTVVRFADENILGPAYDFFHKHHVVDERGKTLSYRRLDELRETLKPILLRRTRTEVAKQLPERIDEIIRIEPTKEQADICFDNLNKVARIMGKKFLTEMDLLQVQKALLMARMSCDSTFLIDQQEPEYSTKLERLNELFEGLLPDPTRKIVLFSEWRRMLDRIERRLENFGVKWVRLDGQVPQKKRPGLIHRFQNDPDCRLILMTNTGSTGLNLQSANTVINVDLPWNPAILEQRIARAYRMGQKQPVHVYKLVTTGNTIEERMLETLASKQELANAALEMESEVNEVQMVSGMEDLKKRLEVILAPRITPLDASQQSQVISEADQLKQRREKVSQASGQLITAALHFAGEVFSAEKSTPVDAAAVNAVSDRLKECVETDEQGRPQLKITLSDPASLTQLAEAIARFMQR
ncbi:MAG: DEAD/DEAH box helicase [Pirellulaceae bacterium]